MIKHRSLTKEKFIVHLRELPNLKLKPSPSRTHGDMLGKLFARVRARVHG